jgi:hypothetical protein
VCATVYHSAVPTPTPSWRTSPTPVTAATLLLALVISGCSGGQTAESSGSSAASAAPAPTTAEATISDAAAQCQPVDAPLTDIPSRGTDEPQLKIPQPPGWEPNTDLNTEVIRYALINSGLTSNGFAPNAVVTLESLPGDVPADAVFESNRNTLVSAGGGTDLTTTPGTLCGATSERVEYTCAATGGAPTRPCRLLNVVTTAADRTYLVTVTVQSTEPADPTYQRDSDAILDGFEVLPSRR